MPQLAQDDKEAANPWTDMPVMEVEATDVSSTWDWTKQSDWKSDTTQSDWKSDARQSDWKSDSKQSDWKSDSKQSDWKSDSKQSDWKSDSKQSDWNSDTKQSDWKSDAKQPEQSWSWDSWQSESTETWSKEASWKEKGNWQEKESQRWDDADQQTWGWEHLNEKAQQALQELAQEDINELLKQLRRKSSEVKNPSGWISTAAKARKEKAESNWKDSNDREDWQNSNEWNRASKQENDWTRNSWKDSAQDSGKQKTDDRGQNHWKANQDSKWKTDMWSSSAQDWPAQAENNSQDSGFTDGYYVDTWTTSDNRYYLAFQGSTVKVTCPDGQVADAKVRGDTLELWGMKGKLKSDAITWDNGCIWQKEEDVSSQGRWPLLPEEERASPWDEPKGGRNAKSREEQDQSWNGYSPGGSKGLEAHKGRDESNPWATDDNGKNSDSYSKKSEAQDPLDLLDPWAAPSRGSSNSKSWDASSEKASNSKAPREDHWGSGSSWNWNSSTRESWNQRR